MRIKLIILTVAACFTSYAQGTVKHAFIVVDNGSNMLRYINQFEPEKNWSVDTDEKPRDIRLSADRKTILISIDKGAVEYHVATGKKTGFEITNHKGVQSAQKLKDGTFLLATQSNIFTCDSNGNVIRNVNVSKKSKPYIRLVTVTKENTLLYTAMKPFCINEVDMDGNHLATIPIPDKGYKAVRLDNGNYLTSSGDAVSVFEVSPAGHVAKTYGGKETHSSLDLTFNSGWQQLPTGNIVATCWHGHGYKGNGPHLVEYTQENVAVWTWAHPDVKQVTNVLVLK